jgi:polyhydroxyalkanoate synthase
MPEGPLAAIEAIEQATGAREVNTIGYCLGGTLMATTLAYMAARNDKRIKAATFFTSLVDFTEAGDLRVFVDEDQIATLEKRMSEKGYLDADAMAKSFSMLRANDLIWSFVVNNYLLGRDPLPFDLLYWNADATRMPAKMQSFYLRRMYMENLLAEPGGISLDGVPVDLGKITIPTYILAAKEDHIAPWSACYAATRLMGGDKRFVLASSGHVAGVINPPAKAKYGYWTGESKDVAQQDWLDSAESHDGSWWLDWASWLKRRSGKKVAARIAAEGAIEALGDAPGEYILK